MAEIRDIKDDEFENTVTNSKVPVLVDFYAPWCGPCRKLSGMIKELSEEFGEKIDVVKVNIDDNIETAKKFTVSSIPTLLVFNEGKACERFVGMVSKSSVSDILNKITNP